MLLNNVLHAVLLIFLLKISVLSTTSYRRIVDGKKAETSIRYMVYLTKADKSPTHYDAWICGGAIVNSNFIVTSAACVQDVQFMYAVAGYAKYVHHNDLESDPCTKAVKKKVILICVPRSYDFAYDKVEKWAFIDLAAVKVESPYDFEAPVAPGCNWTPGPIEINYEAKFQMPNTDALILGWGHAKKYRNPKDTADYNSEFLMYSSILVMDKTECKNLYRNTTVLFPIIDKYMICAMHEGNINENGDLIERSKPNENDGCPPGRYVRSGSVCLNPNEEKTSNENPTTEYYQQLHNTLKPVYYQQPHYVPHPGPVVYQQSQIYNPLPHYSEEQNPQYPRIQPENYPKYQYPNVAHQSVDHQNHQYPNPAPQPVDQQGHQYPNPAPQPVNHNGNQYPNPVPVIHLENQYPNPASQPENHLRNQYPNPAPQPIDEQSHQYPNSAPRPIVNQGHNFPNSAPQSLDYQKHQYPNAPPQNVGYLKPQYSNPFLPVDYQNHQFSNVAPPPVDYQKQEYPNSEPQPLNYQSQSHQNPYSLPQPVHYLKNPFHARPEQQDPIAEYYKNLQTFKPMPQPKYTETKAEDVMTFDDAILNFRRNEENETNKYDNFNYTRRAGICQNDHGGPLVTWRGKNEILIGIASVFKLDHHFKCVGPYLFTSTQCNGAFLDCVIHETITNPSTTSTRATEAAMTATEAAMTATEAAMTAAEAAMTATEATTIATEATTIATSKNPPGGQVTGAVHQILRKSMNVMRRSDFCNLPPAEKGFDVLQRRVSWIDHPDGPAVNELNMDLFERPQRPIG